MADGRRLARCLALVLLAALGMALVVMAAMMLFGPRPFGGLDLGRLRVVVAHGALG